SNTKAVFNEVREAIRRSQHSKKHQQYAHEAIDRYISKSDYVEPDTGLSISQGLLLVWTGIHDKDLIKETYNLDDDQANELIAFLEDDLVYALFETRSAYNIEKGKPLVGKSKDTCPYGYFARLFKTLDHKHPDIKFESILS